MRVFNDSYFNFEILVKRIIFGSLGSRGLIEFNLFFKVNFKNIL